MLRQSLALLLMAGSVGVAGGASASEIPFGADRLVSTNAVEIRSLVAADLNGDGNLDLAGASTSGDEVAWYENDGAKPPAFTVRFVSGVPSGAASIAVGDLDKDGDTDLVVASRFDNTVAWFENDGSAIPVWTRQVIAATAVNPFGVSVADINGDGDLDVLSASDGDNRIAWYENDGASPPGWTTRTVSATALGARSVEAADLDGDGDLDVVSASVDDNRVAWYENNGASPPVWTARTISAVEGTAHAVAVGDIDGDGDVDVVSAALTGDKVTWHANDGTPADGGWVSAPVDTTVDGACFVTVADMDRDGDVDVISSSFDDDLFQWHENDGANPPGFTARDVLGTQDGACAIAVADVDGDGDPDVAAGALLGNAVRWVENRTIHRNALFETEEVLFAASGSGNARAIDTGDLDGDGRVDAVGGDNQGLSFYRNSGMADVPLFKSTLDADRSLIDAIRLADLDGDLDLDALILHGFFPQLMGWYENLGGAEPAWAFHTIPSLLSHPNSAFDSALDVGDLDGDGDMDLVWASQGLSASVPHITWFQNDGSQPPAFTEHVLKPYVQFASLQFHAVAITNINNDAFPDIVTFSRDRLHWFENNGALPTPAFTEREQVNPFPQSFAFVQSLAPGDVDGDGDTDLCVGVSFSNIPAVYWLEQDSTTNPPVFFAHEVEGGLSGSSPPDVLAEDLNGDGHLDLVTGKRLGPLTWYRNDGAVSPAFQTNQISLRFNMGDALAVVNLDGDGDLDLVIPGFDSRSPEVLLNDGNLTPAFDSRESASPGAFLEDGVPVDLDRDGDLDVVTVSLLGHLLAWHENDGGQPPSFDFHPIRYGSNDVGRVLAEDVNGDGAVDVIATDADTTISSYRWLEQGTNADHWIERTIPSANAGSIVAQADIDRDGDLDLITRTTSSIFWLESDGGSPPVFTERYVTNEVAANPLVPVDMDGDGDVDIAVAAQAAGTYRWFENGGGSPASFVARHDLPTADGGSATSQMRVGDFDRDGDVDLLVIPSGSPRNVEMLENNGANPPTFTPRVLGAVESGFSLLKVADVDQDADPDVLVLSASSQGTDLAVYENQGEPSPTFVPRTSPLSPATLRQHFADMDDDGDLDLLTVGGQSLSRQLKWSPNVGGQMMFATTDTSSSLLLEGVGEAQLGIEATHAGRAGDDDAELVSLELLFEEVAGDPLTSAEANAIIDFVSVALDSGSGTYEPGLDTVMTTVSTLSLTSGVQQISFVDDDPNVQIQQGIPRTYFVLVNTAPGANGATPHRFQLTHLTESSSRAQYRDLNLPLTTASTTNRTTGGTLVATPTSDEDNDRMPDVWEDEKFGDPVVNGPTGNADGDSATNLEEYIADTDPTDSDSVFQVLLFQAGAGSDISYLSSAQRNYTLQRNDALGGGPWVSVAGQVNVAGNGDVQTLNDASAVTGRMYRVSVSLP